MQISSDDDPGTSIAEPDINNLILFEELMEEKSGRGKTRILMLDDIKALGNPLGNCTVF